MTNKLAVNEFLHGGDYNPEQWLDTPTIIDTDFKLFDKAQINTLTVGIFSWAKLEPEEGVYDFTWLDDIFDRAEAQGQHIILATPSGARPRWLADKYPEVLRVDENGQRNLYGERHNHCYTAPIYRKKVQNINRKLAERYGKRQSLILWHISNEYGGQCHCDLCQTAFRNWLKAKYQTLDNLNHAYWNTFWSHTYTSWDQVHSPSPKGDTGVMGLNLDWRRFVSHQTIDFYESEIAPLREITPDIPITANFMGGNPPDSHVFYDLDYQEFAKHVDIVSWDSYPNWSNDYESTAQLGMKTALMNDVMRSLKHNNYLIMESTPSQVNWHPVNRAKRPGMHEMGSLQQIAHGANSVLYFQLHQSRGASEMFHGAVIGHQLSDQTRAFKDTTTVGNDLVALQGAIDTKRCQAKVAIVFDYDNMWALDDARNYAGASKKYWHTIREHYQYFWENDIPVELVATDADLTPYDLVIDPMHFMMSQEFAAKLEAYVRQGGHLVGTYITGIVDKQYLAYLGGWPKALHQTYGLEFQETDTLYPKQSNSIKAFGETYEAVDYCDIVSLDAAKVLGTYQQDFYANTPALTVNTLDKGQAYYIGGRTKADFLNEFYGQLTNMLNLKVESPIQKRDEMVSIQIRENKTVRYYFVINFGSQTTITTSKNLYDVLDQKESSVGTYEVAPYGVKVFVEKLD